ncbi:hypothetical protein BC833DRAFT_576578 [Globomyces pollinis-pini]|nr:hypothetical protein BC833DRAFT_576578 [Globomyces pollinis-pini]
MKLTTASVLLTGVLGAKKCSDTPDTFCINMNTSNPASTVYTFHSSVDGWAAMGTGTAMKGSEMVIGWINAGKPVVGNFVASGHTLPKSSATQTVKVLDTLDDPKPTWSKTSFSFSMPGAPSPQLIWAQGATPSLNAEDATKAAFSKHAKFGTSLTETSKTAASPSPTNGASTFGVSSLLVGSVLVTLFLQ